MASVSTVVRTMSFLSTWNCAASGSNRKTTTKKSKASSVQPRKLAVTAWNWSRRERIGPFTSIALRRRSVFRHARDVAIEQDAAQGGDGEESSARAKLPEAELAD